MKVHKFDTIYPRTLWIVNISNEDPLNVLKKFYFIKNIPGWNELDDNIQNELDEAAQSAIAGYFL